MRLNAASAEELISRPAAGGWSILGSCHPLALLGVLIPLYALPSVPPLSRLHAGLWAVTRWRGFNGRMG